MPITNFAVIDSQEKSPPEAAEVAMTTRPNRQNRSTCSRMSVPLVQKQKLRVVNW
jgi:hypothetical protein